MKNKWTRLLFIGIAMTSLTLSACGGGGGDSDKTSSTSNTPPVAVSGTDQNVEVGDLVQLNGIGFDNENDSLTFYWEIIQKPENSEAELYNYDTENPTFIADMIGEYKISLIVNDGQVDSDPSIVSVSGEMNFTVSVSTVSELRQALLAAETNNIDDIIFIEDGIYSTREDGLGTFAFTGTDGRNLTIIGSSPSNVILSGNNIDQVLSFRAFHPINSQSLSLKNVTVQDGLSSGDGGGLFTDIKTFTIYNCNFLNNKASLDGGGLFAFSNIIINKTTIQNNEASNGGGFSNRNGRDTTTISNSLITNNKATDIYSNNGGGGIRIGGPLNIDNSEISHNTATNGGGIHASSGTISNSIISYNTATSRGGGVYAGNSELSIANTILKNNSSTFGSSAVQCFNLSLINSIIKNNNDPVSTVQLSGGNKSYIVNSLFINNSSGIDVYLGANNYLYNNSFINNGSKEIFSNDLNTRATIEHNFIDVSKIQMTAYLRNNIFSANDDDIGFVDIMNQDFRLTSGSIMVDAGVTSVESIEIPSYDFDLFFRPSGASTDIGPYELTQ